MCKAGELDEMVAVVSGLLGCAPSWDMAEQVSTSGKTEANPEQAAAEDSKEMAFPFVAVSDAAPSSFKVEAWAEALAAAGLPEAQIQRLLDGIREGMRIGYTGSREGHIHQDNHPSAAEPQAKAVLDAEVLEELQKRRMIGPFDPRQPPFPFSRTSPLAVVPKADGGWRTIDDLSFGPAAINSAIIPELATVAYESFRKALNMVRSLGRRCLLAKIDWKSAFRQIAVHREDWPCLGLLWRGKLFFRVVLPFGIRSAPHIFSEFAAAFAQCLRAEGIQLVFYLDDILLGGRAGTDECAKAFERVRELAAKLGIVLHPTKWEAPTTRLTFLGIGIDSERMVVFVPEAKRAKANGLLATILGSRRASVHQMQELTGLLQFLTVAIPEGKLMLRAAFRWTAGVGAKLGSGNRRLMQVSTPVLNDLRWWAVAVNMFCQRPITRNARCVEAAAAVMSDACKTGGGAALVMAEGDLECLGRLEWWSMQWNQWQLPEQVMGSMPALELLAIVISLMVWAPSLCGSRVVLYSDAMATVRAVDRQSAAAWTMVQLSRAVRVVASCCSVDLHIAHIDGERNKLADAASRLPVFVSQDPEVLNRMGMLPHLRRHPPRSLPAWLRSLLQQPDWS
jgi:hypothetical protein